MPKKGFSLQSKIIAWSFVPTLIILVAVAVVNLSSYQHVTEDLVVQRDRELTRLLADQVGRDLSRYVDTLNTVARYPSADPAVQAVLAAGPQARRALGVFDAGLVVLNADGTLRSYYRPQGNIASSLNWRTLPCVIEARAQARSAFSDVLVGDDGAPSVIVLAVPIVDIDGDVTGIVAGLFRVGPDAVSDLYRSVARQIGGGVDPGHGASAIDPANRSADPNGDVLRRLYGTIQDVQWAKFRSGVSGQNYVVDGAGRIIYHPDSGRIGQQVSDQPHVEAVLRGRTGAIRTTDVNGDEILATYAPVPGTDWGLIGEESWRALLASSAEHRRFLLILLGLGIVVPTLVVMAGVRRIVRPISQLTEAAGRVAGGDFQHRITVNTKDELHTLANQFNVMAQELRFSYGQLERRVEERTAELEALNRLAMEVSRTLDLEQILDRAIIESLALCQMRCGLAYRIDWASRSLTLVTAQEISADSRETMRQLDLGDPFLGDAIASGTVESVGLDGQSESPLFQRLGAAGIQSALLVPLLARQHPVGLMILAGATTGLCPVPSRELFGSIGHQVGLAMENALLYHQAQEAAIVEERQRLARDLHDSVTQSLYGATLYARAASRLLEHEAVPQAREHLDEVQTSVQQALQEMRLMIFELRPSILEEEGLALALRNRLQAVESRAGLETATDLDEDLELDEDVEEALYLVALEALNNGLKHAQAQHVGLTLKRQNGHVLLEVRDDGRGFSPASADERGGFGWHGMHERAARIGAHLTVDSAPGQGTVVRLELPT